MTAQTTDPTGPQADRELNISANTRWKLLKTGELTGYYIGNKLRVHRESIETYKERNAFKPGERRGMGTRDIGFKKEGAA